MKKSLLVIAIATVSLLTQAQQDPQFTMWQFDRLSVNPAIAGIERMHYVSAFHRDQWDGFDRDPKTYLFNCHGMYGAKQNIGLGATFVTELLGQQQNNILRFAGAYHHALGNNNYISGGMSLGFIGSKLGANWIYIDDNDAAIPRNETAASVFDLNVHGDLLIRHMSKPMPSRSSGQSAENLTAGKAEGNRGLTPISLQFSLRRQHAVEGVAMLDHKAAGPEAVVAYTSAPPLHTACRRLQ